MYNKALKVTEFINKLIPLVEEIFTKDEYIQPVVHILKDNKDKTNVENLILDVSEYITGEVHKKEALNNILKELSKELEPLAIIFISETWMSVIDKKDYNEKIDILPSLDPQKKEGIMISISSIYGNSSKMFLIDRTDKKPKLIRHLGFENDSEVLKGRFINLVKQQDFN